LVSPNAAEAHLDRYVDHIEYVADLIGMDRVGIGFDFFEAIFKAMSVQEQEALRAALAQVYFVPNLTNHAHARNLTAKLIERGFSDEHIARILYGNWMRLFRQML
jgi:membrane dipeptidase